MRIDRFGPSEVQRCWPWLSQLFTDMPDLLRRVTSQQADLCHIIGTDAFVVLSVGTDRDGGQRALWIEDLTGSVGQKPKANIEIMRDVLTDCERLARASDCTEVRIEPGDRTDWKYRLLPLFGFERDGEAMRKVLTNG